MNSGHFLSEIGEVIAIVVEDSTAPGLYWRKAITVSQRNSGVQIVSDDEYETTQTDLAHINTYWDLLGYLSSAQAEADGHTVGTYPFDVREVMGIDQDLAPAIIWALSRSEEYELHEMVAALMSMGVAVFAAVVGQTSPHAGHGLLSTQLFALWQTYRDLCRDIDAQYSLAGDWQEFGSGPFSWPQLIEAMKMRPGE